MFYWVSGANPGTVAGLASPPLRCGDSSAHSSRLIEAAGLVNKLNLPMKETPEDPKSRFLPSRNPGSPNSLFCVRHKPPVIPTLWQGGVSIFNHWPGDRVGFPGGSDGKESACHTGDLSSIPGSGRSPGEENGNPLQYSCLENSMDRGAWWAMVPGVIKSLKQLRT